MAQPAANAVCETKPATNAVYDTEGAHGDFSRGLERFAQKQYLDAVALFRQTLFKSRESESKRPLYESYYGLTLVFLEHINPGLTKCRLAARLEPEDATILFNLAQAEYHAGNRAQALVALKQLKVVAPDHSEAKWFRARMGRRRRQPVIGFLSRENRLNVVLGKLRHQWQKRRAATAKRGHGSRR